MEIVFIFLYFAPAIIAFCNNHPSAGSVAVINLFLGWTLLGWVLALALALMGVKK